MTFDWPRFLDQHGVSYRQAGHDNIRTACPFCNDAGTPNMQISLGGRGWHCWANDEHRGINPTKLLAAVAHIPLDEARLLSGWRGRATDNLVNIVDQVAMIFENNRENRENPSSFPTPPALQLPPEFKPIATGPVAAPFVSYLQRRGFARDRILRFTAEHGLYYCKAGRWSYRVVVTIRMHGKLCGWTGRSITADAKLRYLAAGPDDGAIPTTSLLPWFDQLTGGRRIILCEGPFDSLKLRELGEPSTCCFTAAPGPLQIELLREILPRYRDRILLLDRGTLGTALTVQRTMAGMGLRVVLLHKYKDPGLIPNQQELDNVLSQP